MKRSGEFSKDSSTPQPQIVEALEFNTPDDQRVARQPSNQSSSSSVHSDAKPHSHNRVAWWHSQFNLMLAVFALLILSAGLFIIITPAPNLAVDPELQNTAVSTNRSTSTTGSPAPWTQSQTAAARANSQDVLAKLLATKNDLDKKEVESWAPQRFEQALATAAQGDEFYKQQQFADAINSYESALQKMQSLFELLPELVANGLVEADKAINDGKAELAKQLYQQVLELDAANMAAIKGLARAETLDQVLDLVAAAQRDEIQFELDDSLNLLISSEKQLQEALSVDELYKLATIALTRVREKITEKRFQVAMSKAYRALFSNRYTSAKKAFNEALKIKPGDKTAATALQQSLALDTSSSINSLLQDAEVFAANEQWQSANSNYQTVLQRDANQVSAKLGSLKSAARQQLDERIIQLLADPLALSRTEAKAEALKILGDAKAIKNRGAKLQRQITQLETALSQLEQPLKVRFSSDGITDVSLQKVGSKAIKLGSFAHKNLVLKPGRYIATGVRIGHHDVRKEIELKPMAGSLAPIVVRCQRPIGALASSEDG